MANYNRDISFSCSNIQFFILRLIVFISLTFFTAFILLHGTFNIIIFHIVHRFFLRRCD